VKRKRTASDEDRGEQPHVDRHHAAHARAVPAQRVLELWRHRLQRTAAAVRMRLPVEVIAGRRLGAVGLVHVDARWMLRRHGSNCKAIWAAISIVVAQATARCEERLRREPGVLEWVHVGEPARGGMCGCELHTRDGDDWTLHAPGELARGLAEAAARWPVQLTTTKEARAARLPMYQTEVKLRQLEAQLATPASSLARHLAPQLLSRLRGRSGVATGATARLNTALDRLAILLSAAAQYDRSRQRVADKVPGAAAVWAALASDPPYADEAERLARTIGDALDGRA